MLKETLLNNNGVSTNSANQIVEPKLVKIQGKLTSQIRTRASSNTPYYAFFWLEDCVDCHNTKEICQVLTPKHKSCQECAKQKCQECEIPIIFRLSAQQKPNLDKNQPVILQGQWANPTKSSRPSFKVYSYQNLADK
ncbi:MAG: hypothetical protein LBR43_01210 [Spiroplasmataceae bacterium]|nr:hypothetical protein [Spiroplasmataceae bacterium]